MEGPKQEARLPRLGGRAPDKDASLPLFRVRSGLRG